LSANGRKVLALAKHLNLAADIREVNVYKGQGRTAEYLAINPTGKIPTIDDGGYILSESNAILIYLCECVGAFMLWPSDNRMRARVNQWLFWESAHWQPTLGVALGPTVARRLFPEKISSSAVAPDWSSPTVTLALARLDSTLRDSPFVAGASLTIADISIGGMTTYFKAGQFPFAQYPSIEEWSTRLDAQDWWQATAAALWSS
jgi:glutathione S-transferase